MQVDRVEVIRNKKSSFYYSSKSFERYTKNDNDFTIDRIIVHGQYRDTHVEYGLNKIFRILYYLKQCAF
jgi:hypothetical protein